MIQEDYKIQISQAVENSRQLYSIFDRVAIKNHQFKENRRSELPRCELTADSLAQGFPNRTAKDLESKLHDDLERLRQNIDEKAHPDTFPYIFQKYGWRISGEKEEDAAFCDSFRAKQALAKPESVSGYLLVKGDLTGIQEYIYSGIQPKKADNFVNLSKRLRARSILVSLLTDFIANVILRELEISSWHLLFAGGGHFNLLLPDDKKKALDDLSSKISAAIRQQFGEYLELIVADEKCTAEQLHDRANRCFEAVNIKRDKLKHRQHVGDLENVFKEKIKNDKKNKEEIKAKEERIGGEFPKRSHLLEVVSATQLDLRKGNLLLAEFKLKSHHSLLATRSHEGAYDILLRNSGNSIQSAHILALNNTNFLPKESWKEEAFNFPISFGFRFLGKNAPRPKPLLKNAEENEDAEEIQDAEILDFEQLTKIGQPVDQKKGEGFFRLGSLMLDVDNLGLIFSHGLGKNATLARIITLSREMNYFFTAHFDQRAKEHRIYVVYSGGDDAFAVGKWDRLIRFAKELHEDFQRFICYEENKNSDVHFSAGLFMSNPFYPIGRFYRDAKKLQEEKAKKIDGKNSVDVFDHTLDWTSFEGKIVLGDQLYVPLKMGVTASGRKFSASFAYRIMQLVKTSYYERDTWEGGQFHRRGGIRMAAFARNVANMRYLFARNGFSEADNLKLTNYLEKELTLSFLKKAFNFDAKFNARDYLVALNFAMLLLRSKTKLPDTHGQFTQP